MSVTQESLIQFLEEELAVDPGDISPDTLLFSTGVIDSFALVTLMTFLESQGDFLIDPTDVNLENFDSIDRILGYVSRVAA
jgi:acyl carrier protein